jgi:hypothetical protein
MVLIWIMTPYSLVGENERFKDTVPLNPVCPYDEESIFIRDAGNSLLDYAVSQLRRSAILNAGQMNSGNYCYR